MKRILIISFSNLKHDARVSRQIQFLKKDYLVTVACYDAEESNEFQLIRLKPARLTMVKKSLSAMFLITRLYTLAYRILYPFLQLESLNKPTFDLILANDIESLPLAFHIQKNAKILFDAHEYAPRHFEEKLQWRIFFQDFNKYLCSFYIPKVDAMITINHGLAREYEKEYGVKAQIITNANYYAELEPGKVNPNQIKLVHHGAANPSRHLELMIDMMEFLEPRFTLDLILITPPSANNKTRSYLDQLKSLIAGNSRIRILPPVRSDEVVSFIHQYDMGICFVPHINFNYSHGLPNKLYDFIQARLGIGIGPTEEMTHLVTTFGLGVVSDDFTPKNLAAYLNRLTADQFYQFKEKSHAAARELSAEKNMKILHEMIHELLDAPAHQSNSATNKK